MTPAKAKAIRAILDDVLELDRQRWTCRDCGAQTSMLSERCSGCREEFGENGRPLMPAKPNCPFCTVYGCDGCWAVRVCNKCGVGMCDSCFVGDHGLGKHPCRRKKAK